ncbi:hypothetical protein [Alkalispirochaeta sphaeroplastigenens]|uniref:hypothetical protein n=1 Tax=Alkalispirochaeta sphaeroplastigenens TaxID=1187066 RepID=UPI0011AF9A5E|nr:hypothetical protein [Alkalispirochaeta sphaeroplastigenens]
MFYVVNPVFPALISLVCRFQRPGRKRSRHGRDVPKAEERSDERISAVKRRFFFIFFSTSLIFAAINNPGGIFQLAQFPALVLLSATVVNFRKSAE